MPEVVKVKEIITNKELYKVTDNGNQYKDKIKNNDFSSEDD